MSQDQEKFVVRFPEGMRANIHDAACMNNRSMNAEIVSRLIASFAKESEVPAGYMEFVLYTALQTIVEFPVEQQDDMPAANMRLIAKRALDFVKGGV